MERRHGKHIVTWHENGLLNREQFFRDGQIDGKDSLWSEDGTPIDLITWKDGEMHGEYINWYSDGNKMM